MKYIVRRRLDRKYEVVIDGLVSFVHWDEDRVRQWVYAKYPGKMFRQHLDELVYEACGKV